MRRSNSRLVLGWHAMLVVGVALVGVFDSSAEARVRAHPLVVRFVGTFQPYTKENAGALNTLTVSHKDHTWLFTVEQVNVIGGGQDPGTMLLSQIFPPRLAISGLSAFIESLKKPETLGKRFVLQGWLDLKLRTFRIAEVKEVDEMTGRSADQAVAYLSQFFAKQGWIPAEKVKQAKMAQN